MYYIKLSKNIVLNPKDGKAELTNAQAELTNTQAELTGTKEKLADAEAENARLRAILATYSKER